MHSLLVKVQHKILDEKVDDLIACLAEGLVLAHEQIEARSTGHAPAKLLVQAFGLLLDVIAVKKNIVGYFRTFPSEAEALLQGNEINVDEHHRLYQLLKETLLNEENQLDGPDYTVGIFIRHYALRRPFFEPYLNIWQQLAGSKLSPSPRVLERMVYGTLNLLELMVDESLLHEAVYRPTPEDATLLLRYNQNRVMRIDEALMEGTGEDTAHNTDPEHRRIPCIKCGSYGPLLGYVEQQPNGKQFVAYGFQCNQCGFELFDQKDLLLAGIKPIYEIP